MDWQIAGLAAEVLALTAEAGITLRSAPVRIAYPDQYVPTSPLFAEEYYPSFENIFIAATNMMKKSSKDLLMQIKNYAQKVTDVPDKTFKGPF